MSYSKNHPYAKHVVVRTENPITGIYGPDIHVFFDGRMSQRTAREHFFTSVIEYVWKYEREHRKPLRADSYIQLGVDDHKEYPMPFAQPSSYSWEIQEGITIKTKVSEEKPTVMVRLPYERVYEAKIYDLARGRKGAGIYSVKSPDYPQTRIAYAECWTREGALRGALQKV